MIFKQPQVTKFYVYIGAANELVGLELERTDTPISFLIANIFSILCLRFNSKIYIYYLYHSSDYLFDWEAIILIEVETIILMLDVFKSQ